GGWPGAAGLALRRAFYPMLFGAMGRGVTIGRNVTLRGASKIRIGRGVAIDDQVVLDARGDGGSIDIGDGVLISRNTILRARNGKIVIGAGSDIGANCILATDSRLEIGREVLVAAFCYLTAGGNHVYSDPNTPIIRQGFVSKGGVTIEDDVWIGSHTTVMDGVRIGKGTIVGSHSLVNKSLESLLLAWGSPALPRGKRGEKD
ncbi:MAG: acyltransferase, partial [Kiritimatiellia bacterium]|nr:acyltransferase [Kiritimatiellia bacterium]